MKNIKVYHNARCSKSRSVCQILTENHTAFQTVDYLKNPPSEQELDALLKMLQMNPEQIVRTGEDEYETLKLEQNPPKTREKWLKILVKNPILIERPIVTDGVRAVIGRPPEKALEFLKS